MNGSRISEIELVLHDTNVRCLSRGDFAARADLERSRPDDRDGATRARARARGVHASASGVERCSAADERILSAA